MRGCVPYELSICSMVACPMPLACGFGADFCDAHRIASTVPLHLAHCSKLKMQNASDCVQVINSVLMANVHVADGAHIQGSILCDGVRVHAHSILRDCQVRTTLQQRLSASGAVSEARPHHGVWRDGVRVHTHSILRDFHTCALTASLSAPCVSPRPRSVRSVSYPGSSVVFEFQA